MKRFLLPFLWVLSATTTPAFAADSCSNVTKSHFQCKFELPDIASGSSVSVVFDSNGFVGEMEATCNDGSVSVTSSSCAPKAEDDCLVSASSWMDGGVMCSHVAPPSPLADGQTLSLVSPENIGSIVYECKSGSLRIAHKSCEKESTFGSNANIQAAALHVDFRSTMVAVENITSCTTAVVSGNMGSYYNPRSGEFDIPPSEARIRNDLCSQMGYAVLDDYSLLNQGAIEYWYVIAECSAKRTATEGCDANCLGAVVDKNTSILPVTCHTFGGTENCYVNTCAEPEAPEDLCEDCVAGKFSFTDSTTASTCSIDMAGHLSGTPESFTFQNSEFNGSAEVTCNNGAYSIRAGSPSECYKSCKGGLVSWEDDYGQLSCAQRVPDGEYYQGDDVSLTSILHHGDADFECDNGVWKVQSGASCILDCDGELQWGDGTSRSGLDKTNACSGNVDFLEHLTQSTSKIASTATNTSGSTHLSCDNGIMAPEDSECNLGCSSQTASWDGGNCTRSSINLGHDVTGTISTDNSFLAGYSGSAQFTCDDGKIDLVAGTDRCYQDCSAENYSFSGGDCSISLPAARHGTTQAFFDLEQEGTMTCDDGKWKSSGMVCLASKRSCGSESVSWGGGCSGTVSGASHGIISTASSSVGDGSASYQCNDGSWTATGASSCSLDCSGTISWGDGNACSASVPFMLDGASSTNIATTSVSYRWVSRGASCYKTGAVRSVSSGRESASCSASQAGQVKYIADRDILWCRYGTRSYETLVCEGFTSSGSGVKANSTSGTTGSTHYSCSNGNLSTSDSVCYTGCSGTRVDWGASCSAPIRAGAEGVTVSVSVSSDDFLAYESVGSAKFKCVNSRWEQEGSGTCKQMDLCGTTNDEQECK